VVVKAARSLNYPMENLRRLRAYSRTVLILIRDTTWQPQQDIRNVEVDGKIAFGALTVLRKQTLTVRVQPDALQGKGAEQYVSDPTIAGLVMASGIVDHGFLRILQEATVPFVVAGSHVRPLRANCVMADYLGGIQQAVDHLVAQGRRRIALVNGPPTTTSSDEKRKGYQLAMAAHGLALEPAYILECTDFASECGYAQTLQLLTQVSQVDGIVYASDSLAMGGLRSLREHGLRVPEDVAITGFYDYELARFTDPPLTSLHIELDTMGAIAARRLCMMLEEPDNEAWCVSVPTSMVVRESG
jgi:LacI family transcriptional regulator